MATHSPDVHGLDAGRLIDDGPWSTYQKLLIFGTALTIVVDGLDNQLLPSGLCRIGRDRPWPPLREFRVVVGSDARCAARAGVHQETRAGGATIK
jgi:hypothetical protein